jgi:PAS domain S-box-containing protein
MSNNSYSDQSSESYKMIFESSLDAILLTRPDGTIFYANSAAEEMYGYTQKEICDLGRSGIVDTDDPNLSVILEERARLGKSKGELTLIKKNGSKFPGEVSTSIFTDTNNNENTFMTIRDITQRKLNEKITQNLLENEQQLTEELKASNEELQSTTEELHKSHEKLKKNLEELTNTETLLSSIMNLSSDVIYVKDLQSNWIFVNPALEQITGKKSAELLGKNDLEIYSNLEVGKKILENDRRIMELGQEEILEEDVETPDGMRTFISVKTPRFDENGQVMGIVGISHDITEIKKVEKIKQNLLETEQELTEELQTSNEELLSTTEELQSQTRELRSVNIELMKSSKLLSAIYDLNPDAIVLTTMSDSKIIDCNQEYLNQIGYSREETIGKTSKELNLISEITREAYIDETRENTRISNFEGKIKRKNGSIIDVVYSTRQITVDNVRMILNIGHDITELKKAEKQMAFDSLLLGQVNDAVLAVDHNFKINYWNKGAEKMFGYTRKEALGVNTVELLRPNYVRGERENKLEELEEKGTLKTIMYAKHKNGTEVIVDQNVSLIVNDSGVQTGYVVVDRDITENKNAEDALRESEKKYRSIVETANEGIMITDPSAKIKFVNIKFSEMIGYSIEELVGMDSFSLIDRDEYEKAKQRVENRKKGISGEYDLKFRTKNGKELWTHGSVSPIYDHNGSHISNLTMYTDISERKKAENEIQKTLDELRRSNQELERFAYVSSHDLQEPLRMVTLYSQLLEKRYKDRLDDDADDFIDFIVENAKRMKYLIDDLLEYSRITRQTKEFEDTDLGKVLGNVLTNLSLPIIENDVDVTYDSLPTVLADKNQMLQVFQNLITNAIKFRGEEPPKIDISAQKNKKEWIFAFKDNGIGIDSKHQEQIFEVFKRLHTREEYPGTGIGLSIVQKIIERHGGRIWVESESGKGTIFYFTIPMNLKDEISGEY